MSLSSPSLRRFVRRALVDTTGAASPDRAQLTSAFDALCNRLHQRLQTLFGAKASTALFVRARHVATSEFPWLAAVVSRNGVPCSIDGTNGLEAVDLATVEEGFAAVLAHNIGLLSTFVGEDLVLPIVQQAWGDVTMEAPGNEDVK